MKNQMSKVKTWMLIGCAMALCMPITGFATQQGTRDTRFVIPGEVSGAPVPTTIVTTSGGTPDPRFVTQGGAPQTSIPTMQGGTPDPRFVTQGGAPQTSIPTTQGGTPDARFVTQGGTKGAPASVTRRIGDARIKNCKEWVNVRSSAGAGKNIIGKAYVDQTVKVLYWNTAGDWFYVRVNDNLTGWVSAKFISFA